MMWRLSDVEVGYDDLALWAAPPEDLVTAALHRALFGSGVFAMSSTPTAPELSAHVSAFEGNLADGKARVEIELTLSAQDTLRMHRVRAERPAAGRDPTTLARALGAALEECARQAASWIATQSAR